MARGQRDVAARLVYQRYEGAQKLSKLGRGPLGKLPLPGWSTMRELPAVPEKTFREWWRERAR